MQTRHDDTGNDSQAGEVPPRRPLYVVLSPAVRARFSGICWLVETEPGVIALQYEESGPSREEEDDGPTSTTACFLAQGGTASLARSLGVISNENDWDGSTGSVERLLLACLSHFDDYWEARRWLEVCGIECRTRHDPMGYMDIVPDDARNLTS